MHSHATEKGQYPNLWTTMIDPSNGKVLGRRDYTNCFAFTVYRMHHNLLLYDWWGHELVGAIGFLLFGMACSGLYLWWRERVRFWRSVSIRRQVSARRLMRDLHNTGGLLKSTVTCSDRRYGYRYRVSKCHPPFGRLGLNGT